MLLAQNLSRAWRARTEANRARSGLTAHRIARRLSRARGLDEVYAVIAQRMPMAVRATIGVLAVPDPSDGRLIIVATHGYPRELVERMRIDPGTGVLGSVFSSGRPLYVREIDRVSHKRRRLRYRTDSFIAMPLVSGGQVLGVMATTDRRDDKPFTSQDVSVLRAAAAPAALALSREVALAQAEQHALTAAIDPLTGVFNRRHLESRLEEELQRSRRHSHSLAFLMLDIDDFKQINDSYGHLAGDAVVRDVADILRRSVRVFDVCARFGGDEFAIIMPGSGIESANMVAARIRDLIETYHPTEAGLENLKLTVSIGLAVASPDMSIRELIDHADRAMFAAKHAGKNRVGVAAEGEAGRAGRWCSSTR
jgi:diguanylate cyclase (GGDEF)-like protein